MYRYKVIGKRLRECRSSAHLTQEAVARHCQCSRKTVSAWETGRRKPTLIDLIELCALYEESADYVLSGRRRLEALSPMVREVFRREGVMPEGPGFAAPVCK